MTPSKTRAHEISRNVLDALQAADELGGPEREDYISMMENLARLCMVRAATARVTSPEQEVLRWAKQNIHPECFIEGTGGGCTALQIPATHGDDYWWLTDDACTPDRMVAGDEPFCLCLYKGGQDPGDLWVGFMVRSLEHARDLIQSHCGAQW